MSCSLKFQAAASNFFASASGEVHLAKGPKILVELTAGLSDGARPANRKTIVTRRVILDYHDSTRRRATNGHVEIIDLTLQEPYHCPNLVGANHRQRCTATGKRRALRLLWWRWYNFTSQFPANIMILAVVGWVSDYLCDVNPPSASSDVDKQLTLDVDPAPPSHLFCPAKL